MLRVKYTHNYSPPTTFVRFGNVAQYVLTKLTKSDIMTVFLKIHKIMQQLPGQENIATTQQRAGYTQIPTATEFRDAQKKDAEASSSPARGIIVAFGALIGIVIVFLILIGLFRALPGIGSAVAGVFNAVFDSAPQESISLEVENHTLQFADAATFGLVYTVRDVQQSNVSENPFLFSYECIAENETLFDVLQSDGSWRTLPCNTQYATYENAVTVRPIAARKGMTSVQAFLALKDMRDETVLFIANDTDKTDLRIVSETTDTKETTEEVVTTTPEETTTKETVTPTPTAPVAATQPIQYRTVAVSQYTGPADLAVQIVETGIVLNGKFYDVAAIPSERTAAVRFTVRNLGGVPSGSWTFTATLPIEGDETYRYDSPVQRSIPGGSQGEFTLSFDEVLQERSGTIEIRIRPTNTSDRAANNTDITKITIDTDN